MKADGSGVAQQLTFGTFDDYCPAWRSDGEKIDFVRNISGHVRIWTMNSDGTEQINITGGIPNSGQSQPDWRPLNLPNARIDSNYLVPVSKRKEIFAAVFSTGHAGGSADRYE